MTEAAVFAVHNDAVKSGASGPAAAQVRRRLGLLAVLLVVAAGLGLSLGLTVGAGPAASAVPGLDGPVAGRSLGISGLSGTWQLELDDEFSAQRLDAALWHTCYSWGCTISPNDPPATNANPENEWYEAANVVQRGGELALTARPQAAHGRSYTSGMIQSNGSFDFTYGLVEVRAKIPAGAGTWPAIWLVPQDLSWPPEIDVMEYWGSQPGRMKVTLHYGPSDLVLFRDVPSPALAGRWHTYAVDWAPGEISWYLDGALVYRVARSVTQPMYPIVNLAVADPPAPAPGTFPASMDVRWVRIYQQSGVGTSTCSVGSCVLGG
jgi:beta-glucanase (GH16 family)